MAIHLFKFGTSWRSDFGVIWYLDIWYSAFHCIPNLKLNSKYRPSRFRSFKATWPEYGSMSNTVSVWNPNQYGFQIHFVFKICPKSGHFCLDFSQLMCLSENRRVPISAYDTFFFSGGGVRETRQCFKSGKSLYKGKGHVPHLQLLNNCGLSCLLFAENIFQYTNSQCKVGWQLHKRYSNLSPV